MSISKTSNAQVFRLMLYTRPLHPELFNLQNRRIHNQLEYEVETWVTPNGHVIRFQAGDETLTEAVIDSGDHLPEAGLEHALACLGEKDFELECEEDFGVGYVTTVQTESLTDNLYMATLRELRDFVREANSLAYEWIDDDGTPCLSIVDTQVYRKEFHVQSYHLLGGSGIVLRTQSIFEVK
jgi:hypothetical protein